VGVSFIETPCMFNANDTCASFIVEAQITGSYILHNAGVYGIYLERRCTNSSIVYSSSWTLISARLN